MNNMPKSNENWLPVKIVLTVLIVIYNPFVGAVLLMLLALGGYWEGLMYAGFAILPALIPLIWLKKKKIYLIIYCSMIMCLFAVFGVQSVMKIYDDMITIDVTPAINVEKYLPFDEDSKIVKIDSKTLKLTQDLPVIDGAAALFPVYSAFVNAVYPDTAALGDGVFEYNNTVGGYRLLAEQQTDIFVGAYPSQEQRDYAAECGTEFVYTPIGSEAFVFFVHKDNPIDSLTVEQIKGIYSGEITNWKEVGGNDEEIVAYQRNEGSGSQSMLERFMGDTPIMEAPSKEVIGGMGDIIEQVGDYKSQTCSIGFSFRFYVEGMVKNPDIKVIAVDGVAPAVDTIKSKQYPVVTDIYAVTYEGNTNKNVDLLVNWMLSEEGQYIIEETGYTGVSR